MIHMTPRQASQEDDGVTIGNRRRIRTRQPLMIVGL